ncbi:Ni/Fe hydrogenase [Malaciobacter molluscorum LMG 25693]|uniref:Ni/Fe hydrogenase n=2 Tax=Malaciobacter molluscorum LMG 25693 TaxID=870501 RepID=A0A2G1DLE4_9BACT|nr:Ni/Fe hydrogenase [Malaciobacter molluscorum]PHO19289.1 Ni/Fe hydrogenase [Malaciobacter molluscorum LMG 25693]RXJ96449.1 Ni/Fe hydrogenase [Malaciobacter molluscorum]
MMKHKPKIVWLQAITCNGNTHSLLSANPSRFELLLNTFDFFYHPSITTEKTLDDVLNLKEIDFLLLEGAVTSNKQFYQISDSSVTDLLKKVSKKSKYIISVGSCASYGGIHAKFEENSDIKGLQDTLNIVELKKLKQPIINLTGCPVHPEWILQTLFTLKEFGVISLDMQSRPKDIYYGLAHHGCTRNEYFEWKVEAKSFGHKEGCLFYEEGCRGPMTHSNCNRILWNDVNTKTRAGMPCIGCTEFDFPRDNMLETKKNIGIPSEVPFGINKRAYLTITGVAKTFKIDRLNKKLIE